MSLEPLYLAPCMALCSKALCFITTCKTDTNTAVFEMIADENTVMIKAAHVGQLLLLKKEKVWQRERSLYFTVS